MFKEMKFRVKNPGHSEAIQRKLFDLGYKWSGSDGIIYTNKACLYTELDGEITHSDLSYFFNDDVSDFTEYDLIDGELKPVQAETETETEVGLKEMKFRTSDRDHYELIIHHLVKLGYSQLASNDLHRAIWQSDKECLYTNVAGRIIACNLAYFKGELNHIPEYVLNETVTYDFKKLAPPPKIIEIAGKNYLESDVLNLLSTINSVG